MRKKTQGHRTNTEFVRLSSRKCKACWKCVNACPEAVIGKLQILWHKHISFDYADDCIGCMNCMDICSAKAITPDLAKGK